MEVRLKWNYNCTVSPQRPSSAELTQYLTHFCSLQILAKNLHGGANKVNPPSCRRPSWSSRCSGHLDTFTSTLTLSTRSSSSLKPETFTQTAFFDVFKRCRHPRTIKKKVLTQMLHPVMNPLFCLIGRRHHELPFLGKETLVQSV